MLTTKKVATLIAALALAGAAAAPIASADPPKQKCNSGNGNLSESTPATDCDPGNSGGHNNGGD